MFTIEQINAAHANVKSGADFPAYIQELSKLGIISYTHYVDDGRIQYDGALRTPLIADTLWSPLKVAEAGSIVKLKEALAIHQAGQTSYLTFCEQSAKAGVEKWIVDVKKMTCTYYDRGENELWTEVIPAV